ncbi:MAG: CDP-diacylglycerol--glycerol-3-phosphate 3-phosphatidyltransferase [Deltaproteobacteria bacterium]|nr:CDP-diacylglycerol--glycerol-3-phosphate 3-phosphatidyltransferase [Deltaproteobacteria bacterium]
MTMRRGPLAELGNLPNLLTLGRVLLIPIFLVFLFYGSRFSSAVAAFLFIGASLTDVVDGFLARRMNLITTMGKFLDPIADKLLVMSALVMLLSLGRVPAWVVILILAREFIISALRTLAMSEGVVIAAGQGGKWKTSLQMVGLIGLILHYPYRIDFLFFEADLDLHRMGLWLVYISLVPAILSGVAYFQGFWEAVEDA